MPYFPQSSPNSSARPRSNPARPSDLAQIPLPGPPAPAPSASRYLQVPRYELILLLRAGRGLHSGGCRAGHSVTGASAARDPPGTSRDPQNPPGFPRPVPPTCPGLHQPRSALHCRA